MLKKIQPAMIAAAGTQFLAEAALMQFIFVSCKTTEGISVTINPAQVAAIEQHPEEPQHCIVRMGLNAFFTDPNTGANLASHMTYTLAETHEAFTERVYAAQRQALDQWAQTWNAEWQKNMKLSQAELDETEPN